MNNNINTLNNNNIPITLDLVLMQDWNYEILENTSIHLTKYVNSRVMFVLNDLQKLKYKNIHAKDEKVAFIKEEILNIYK